MFDAGALIFRIQTVGRQLFEQDQRAARDAFDRTGDSAKKAGTQLESAGKATDAAGTAAATAAPKQDRQAKSAEAQAEAARKLSSATLIAGTAIATVVGLAVAKYASFDQQLSNVNAALGASVKEQRALADAALQAGADTAFSANEAAQAQEELAKAGLTASQIVGGSLNGALALAAAGQLQVARSAEIMATTLKQYRLPAQDAAHVSDLLAAGAGNAQGSVDDLALALQYVGPVASGMQIGLEETVGALALFASQGQLGERAGTGLRGVIQSLVSPSALAAETMRQYGVEVFDTSGKAKGLSGIAQELQDAFGGLTEAERSQALGRIFGNEQITAARVLYEGGGQAVAEWTEKVNDSGYAAEQAAERQNNLAGDLEKLGGSLDTALIRTGSGANDVLREMVQTVESLVDGYGELPAPVQGTALALGIATGAVILFAGAAVGLRAKFIELKSAMDDSNASMGKTALLGAGAGLALSGVLAVIGLIAQQQAEARAKAEAYADALESGATRSSKAFADLADEALSANQKLIGIFDLGGDSAYENAERLGLSLGMVRDAALGNADALRELQQVQEDIANSSTTDLMEKYGWDQSSAILAEANINQVVNAVKGENASIEEAIKLADLKAEAERGSTAASADGIPVTQSAADAYLEAAGNVEDLDSQLQGLIDTVLEANGLNQDAAAAAIDYQNALAEVDEVIRKASEAVDENGDGLADYVGTLDQATQAGRDNKDMFIELAKQSQDAAEAQFALDNNTESYRANLEAGKQALIDRITALTGNRDAAQQLADSIYSIPSETQWRVIADTAQARQDAEGFIRDFSGRQIPMYVLAMTDSGGNRPINVGQFADGAVVKYFAGGGHENHIAQTARAGTYRVWAEPETGGESYIPHAASKRARSEQIMAETAAILGGTYIPSGAVGYADGSPTGRRGSAAGVVVNNHITGTQQTDPRILGAIIGSEIQRSLTGLPS